MVLIPPSYEQALAEVKARVAGSRTSFHAGMAVLPKARREAMYGLYGFCREVDDIADDSPSPEIAAKNLELWRGRIADVFRGRACDAITVVLRQAIQPFNLDEKDFHEIIDGMEMDSVAIVAPGEKTLDRYCDLVASAVGRVSVRIFGDSSAEAMQVAHHLGRALQLTNILRDIAEDAARGRLYLPSDLLDKHGIISRNPRDILRSPHLASVCRDLADDARDQYQWADECMSKCIPSAMRPARIMRFYYGAIFDQLVAKDWQNPSERVRLPKWKKIALLARGYFG
ncbi:MAG: presqualene diphosphate synthase HpnD [Alphaproteobacteria bacterium]|nr:presqualene diphosphate synthase HpnD [Alphaproteobacteria bacterium]